MADICCSCAKTGRVELLSARGALASAQLESALDGPAQVRVVRRAGTIEVYVNGAEQPVLSASAPDYTEGFCPSTPAAVRSRLTILP